MDIGLHIYLSRYAHVSIALHTVSPHTYIVPAYV